MNIVTQHALEATPEQVAKMLHSVTPNEWHNIFLELYSLTKNDTIWLDVTAKALTEDCGFASGMFILNLAARINCIHESRKRPKITVLEGKDDGR